MPTNSKQLILEAKRLQRLQTQRRKLKTTLRSVQQEINLVKRHIRALSAENDDDQLPPGWVEKGIQ